MIIKNKHYSFVEAIGYATAGIELITRYHSAFDFRAFTDKGNFCYSPFKQDPEDLLNEAEMRAAVTVCMAKHSKTHKTLSSLVSKDLGMSNHPSYDNLTKIVSRILSGPNQDLNDLEALCKYSISLKGLNKILSSEQI